MVLEGCCHRALRRTYLEPSIRSPSKQTVLVIPAHSPCAERKREVESSTRVRTTHDEVTDHHEAVVVRETNTSEQGLKLCAAAVNVTNDDCPRHARLQLRLELGALGDHDDAALAHEPALCILF